MVVIIKPDDAKNKMDGMVELPSCTSSTNVSIEELTNTVFGADEDTVCRMVKGCPLIDFAGPGLNVFQVTVRDKHEKNFNGMKDLLLAAGFLQYKKGILSKRRGI